MWIFEGLCKFIFYYIIDLVYMCLVVKFCCFFDDVLLSDILILIINEIRELGEFIRCMYKYIINVM